MRLEQSIDAIAVEVERISEGQRFTAKLMAEGRVAGVTRCCATARHATGALAGAVHTRGGDAVHRRPSRTLAMTGWGSNPRPAD